MYSTITKTKNISVTFFLFISLFSPKIFSQINSDLKFYPLHVGDIRQYLIDQKSNYPNGLDTTFYVTTEVISEEFIDGKNYFNITSTNPSYENGGLLRIDSTDATIWGITFSECMMDSLSMSVGDGGFTNDCFGTVTCISESEAIFFGENRIIKKFNYNPAMTMAMNKKYQYAYGIGLINSITSYPDGIINSSLVYAKIDGVESGINPNVNFYPLHVGDTWQYLVEYQYRDSSRDSSFYLSVSVDRIDTLNDSKAYFRISNSQDYFIKHIRVDSTDATLWNESEMLDSLSMEPGDIMSWANSNNPKGCIKDSVEILFNKNTKVKTFTPVIIPTSQIPSSRSGVKYLYKYGLGIGEIYSETSDILIEASKIVKSLVYAKIDGVEYGELKSKNTDFFPLQVGNKWVYNNDGVSYDIIPTYFNYDYIVEVVSDTINVDGTKYFKIIDMDYNWTRVDTTFNRIYTKYNLSNDFECLFADFSVITNEKYEVCFGNVYNSTDSDTLIWGKKRSMKKYFYESFFTNVAKFVNGIGIVEKQNEFDFGYSTTSLKGCIIYGTIYGDTTFTDIDDNPNKLPTHFSLSQNFPNPFNPSTTIKYSILSNVKSETSNVKIVVFDLLGREIATLINEEQKAGNYEVKFDASGLASGIYFCRLTSGSFNKSIKMLLVR